MPTGDPGFPSSMRPMKSSPRTEYKESQFRRARQSATLAEKFPELAALKVDFAYLNPNGSSRNREVRFSVNLVRASSVFRIECLNPDCVGGDYDLSDVIVRAVSDRQASVAGELQCEGWQDRFVIDQTRCHQRIAFKLALEFRRRKAA